MKGRSYSTTALPAGALIQLKFQEKRERKTICSFHPGNATTNLTALEKLICDNRHVQEVDEDEEAEKEEVCDEDVQCDVDVSTAVTFQTEDREIIGPLPVTRALKPTTHRFNLTSDYDSSNDSPSGSDVAADDIISSDPSHPALAIRTSQRRSLIGRIEEESTPSPSTAITVVAGSRRCILCGCCVTGNWPGQNQVIDAVWPNVPPAALLLPSLDDKGHFIVDSLTYDLDGLAADPLLSMVTEWDYPIFDLYEDAGDAILSKLSYRIFFETGLMEAFRIPLQEFLNFFRALEKGYKEKPCKKKS